MAALKDKVSIVVLTCNRREELLASLGRLAALEEPVPICVVDNGSRDGTAEAVAAAFPDLTLLRLPANLGAAGRNHGVARVTTPYVAFSDDDTWWAPGALSRACVLLDGHPRLAAVTARVLVGSAGREDPTSTFMAASPLPNVLGIPGTAVSGFLGGACVMRRAAFLAAGGYEPRFFIGGEEGLLALDLMAAGWHLGYAPELLLHHHPSPRRDASQRRRMLLRNALWCAWLRRPAGSAWRETLLRLRQIAARPELAPALLAALRGLPWILRERRVVPPAVEARVRCVEAQGAPRAPRRAGRTRAVGG